jgi:hypothetical protein
MAKHLWGQKVKRIRNKVKIFCEKLDISYKKISKKKLMQK